LDIALEALVGVGTTVVVGAVLPTSRPVRWTREAPVGGGPLAALAAALPFLHAPNVVVLACDLPFVTAGDVERLVGTLVGTSVGTLVGQRGSAVAAVAVDRDGRDQPLLACYSLAALRTALPPNPADASMRSLLDALEAKGPLARVSFDSDRSPTVDCDTAADLARAQESV